jgi:phytoene synthase
MTETALSPDLVAQSEAVLQKHARSFSWAAPFLRPDARADAAVVYAFCRLADDTVDEAPSEEVARVGVERLTDELEGRADPRPLVRAYLDVAQRRGIDASAAPELLEGMRSDLDEVRVDDDDELLDYCYRAAGTVGLMMAGILAATSREALPHAIHLGVGMQLTNICRDVKEDAERGRVYLPAARLRALGVETDDIVRGEFDADAVYAVVRDLLALAERYYRSADAGLSYLPRRARLCVLVAGRIYRAIGRKVLRRGVSALSSRTRVGPMGKLGWLLVATAQWVARLPRKRSVPYADQSIRWWFRSAPAR